MNVECSEKIFLKTPYWHHIGELRCHSLVDPIELNFTLELEQTTVSPDKPQM